jgi:hypothetical protein
MTVAAEQPVASPIGRFVDSVARWLAEASGAHDYLFEPRDGDPVEDRSSRADRWRGG